MRIHGPLCIPFKDMHGRVGGWPTHPGLHGRYFPLDLDENNRHSIDAYCSRFPDRPRPTFGWGVCRQGFGLQHHDGVMTEAEADAWAVDLNARIEIGVGLSAT